MRIGAGWEFAEVGTGRSLINTERAASEATTIRRVWAFRASMGEGARRDLTSPDVGVDGSNAINRSFKLESSDDINSTPLTTLAKTMRNSRRCLDGRPNTCFYGYFASKTAGLRSAGAVFERVALRRWGTVVGTHRLVGLLIGSREASAKRFEGVTDGGWGLASIARITQSFQAIGTIGLLAACPAGRTQSEALQSLTHVFG